MKKLFVGVVNLLNGTGIETELFVDWGEDAQTVEADWVFRATKKHVGARMLGSSCYDITEYADARPE